MAMENWKSVERSFHKALKAAIEAAPKAKRDELRAKYLEVRKIGLRTDNLLGSSVTPLTRALEI